MELKLTLEEATELLRGERIYQDSRWPGHTHTAQEYLVYCRDYINEALHLLSHNDETAITQEVMGIVRKVAAMCVAFRQERNDPNAYHAHARVPTNSAAITVTSYLADMYKEAESALLGHAGGNALFALQSLSLQAMQLHGAPARGESTGSEYAKQALIHGLPA